MHPLQQVHLANRVQSKALQHVDHLFVLPAAPADDDEPGHRFGRQGLRHRTPQVEQQQVVLPRLDGGQDDEVDRCFARIFRDGGGFIQVHAELKLREAGAVLLVERNDLAIEDRDALLQRAPPNFGGRKGLVFSSAGIKPCL